MEWNSVPITKYMESQQHWIKSGTVPLLFPADNHSSFCNAADLPSSPLVLKPRVCNFTCWRLGECPQSGKEPDSLEFPLTEFSATASGLHQHHSAKKKKTLNPRTVPAGEPVPKTNSVFCSLSFPWPVNLGFSISCLKGITQVITTWKYKLLLFSVANW